MASRNKKGGVLLKRNTKKGVGGLPVFVFSNAAPIGRKRPNRGSPSRPPTQGHRPFGGRRGGVPPPLFFFAGLMRGPPELGARALGGSFYGEPEAQLAAFSLRRVRFYVLLSFLIKTKKSVGPSLWALFVGLCLWALCFLCSAAKSSPCSVLLTEA